MIRSLFLKIFLWFLSANLLIGLALFFVGKAIGSKNNREHWKPPTDALLTIHAQAVAQLYQQGREKALRAYLQQANQGSGAKISVFLVSNGPDERERVEGIDHSMPPATLLDEIKTSARQGDSIWTFSDTLERGVRRAVIGKGPVMVVVFENIITQPPHGGPLADLYDPINGGWLRLLSVSLVIVLVCYGLAFYLTAPAVKLRHATRLLANGDLSARVAPQMGKRRDELADLGRDFDQMAERIEQLVRSERQLLSDISHELRSPLARLNVALDIIEKRPAATLEYLPRIRLEAERLEALIGQLLTLKRLEGGILPVKRTPINLYDLVQGVVQDANFEAEGLNRSVKLLQGKDCWIHGDTILLSSAIENVVRNAVHYTREHSPVEVTLFRHSSGQALITVRDAGPGVPEESLDKLFLPFYRVANARDRRSGGHGLGLAITEHAVRFHGGSVKASNAPTGGLIVEIYLPLDEVGPPDEKMQ